MADIIDEIDALVDWQLEQEASGYDHNINQVQCRCGEDFHGLPITERMKEMRSYDYLDPKYSYADDESHVLCPGSLMEGPLRAINRPEPWGLEWPGYERTPTRVDIYEGPRQSARWWRCDRPREFEVQIDRDTDHEGRWGSVMHLRRHRAVMRMAFPGEMESRSVTVELGFDPATHNYLRHEVDQRNRPVRLDVFTAERPPLGVWHPVEET